MKTLRFTKWLLVVPAIIIGASVFPVALHAQSVSPPSKLEVTSAMARVNDYWIGQNPDPGDNRWARAVYFIGDVAHYMTTGETKYLDYATNWAEQHNWQLRGGCAPKPPSNLALNQSVTVTCSSEPEPENGCTNTVDGDTNDRWSATGFPQQVEVDLHGFYSIGSVNVHPYMNRAYQYYVGAKAVSKAPYVTLVDRSANTFGGSVITDTLDPYPARYLRLRVENAYGYTGPWVSLREWEILGTAVPSADNQTAGRTYLALYDVEPTPDKILCITTNIDSVVDRYLNHATLGDWWWIDAMFMAMPTYAKLSVENGGDYYYSETMYALYQNTKTARGLYNPEAGLWYRDENYLPSNNNGKNVFWSRGNGWVFAALADVLATLPPNDPHYDEYRVTFTGMAAALKAVQRPDGFWNSNLTDPTDHPGPETSGTALFTYGMATGIGLHILSPDEYLEPVVRAWNGMTTAIHPDGKLGFVQGVGSAPADATDNDTADFGVGVFLLAGNAVYKIAEDYGPTNLALNQPVTCSSEPEPANGCNHTVDGDVDDRWSAIEFPQWVEVDLGDVYSISGVNVHAYKDRAYQYYVEVKTAAADPYVRVVDRSSNTQGGFIISDTFGPVSARYVRLRVEGAHGYTGTWVSLREWEVLGSTLPPPTNLALNQPVTCSSEPQPANGCTHTVDGDTDNRWSAHNFPQWVEVDLGDVYSINGVNVHPYEDRAYRYYIEVKTDVYDPYVPVVDRSGNTQGGTVISDTFGPVSARYVRLRVEGAYGYTGAWVSLREWEVLGSTLPPPSNLALNQPVTCSDEPEPENGCTHTVDGDADNRWSAHGFPQWVEVDLGDVHSISGANMHPYQNRAYRYYIEVKADFYDPYVPVVDRSGNTQGGTVIPDTFGPLSARYVRLRVEGAYGYTGTWVSLREWEILGN